MTTTPTLWKSGFQVNTTDDGVYGETQNGSKVVALANGRFLVVWVDDSGGLFGFPGLEVLGQVYDAQGRPVGNEFTAGFIYNDDNQQAPDIISFDDGSFAVAYQTTDAVPIGDGENINIDYYNADGSFSHNIDLRQNFAGPPGVDERAPSIVALANGDAAIVYEQSDNGAASNIVGHILANQAAGTLINFETTAEATRAADLAVLSNGSLIVAYERDLTIGAGTDYTQIWYSVRTSAGVLTQKLVASTDLGTAAKPVIATLSNGGFVIAWTDSDAGPGAPGAVARYFSAPGVAGVEVLRETSGAGSAPTVTALADGGFVLGWSDGTAHSLKGQRFNVSGQEVGTAFTLATTGNPSQMQFSLLDDGRFVATFTADNGGDRDILLTIFDPRTSPIQGTSGKDVLTSRIEGATVQGLDGDDFLYGMAGNDTLEGGKGGDYLSGGTGVDLASYSTAAAAVTADLVIPANNLGEAAGDRYNSIERLIGSDFNDTLFANSSSNVIYGGKGNDTLDSRAGNDTLSGQEGNDTLTGGLGADYLSGGTGSDTASYKAATAGVVVNLKSPAANTGEAKGDTYNSIENIEGSAHSDNLTGTDSTANRVLAGAGNDVLNGATGNDLLTGGGGKDHFVFNTALNASTNVDTINDYVRLDDTIRLEDSIFVNIAKNLNGTIVSTAFKELSSGAIDPSDRIIYNRTTGELFYDRDGSGGTYGAIKFAVIDNTSGVNSGLTSADFVLI
ncbi:MAG TPA: calcium-binding protein [Pararhizobium sp.]|uniref:calcium-binding protein n=1 Tax=Pararhizobium sp. TaxID=1977563 RepID=UPI002CF32086|nr:calcium-binding protein [Pararhizobium sp.]HTO34071.1 calcium-binding protein [Pararhizobium sp.]